MKCCVKILKIGFELKQCDKEACIDGTSKIQTSSKKLKLFSTRITFVFPSSFNQIPR